MCLENLALSTVNTFGRVNTSTKDKILGNGCDLLGTRKCPEWTEEERKRLSELLSPLSLIDYLLQSGFP
jgi:hypothetical protein